MNRRFIIPMMCVAIGLLIGSLATYGIMTTNRTLQGRGTIKKINIDVYSDESCTTPLTAIDWGILDPGQVASRTCYVKNNGNSAFVLSMVVGNWNPVGTDTYMTCTWDREGANLIKGASIPATFTLTVSPTITGIENFSFDITLSGTG